MTLSFVRSSIDGAESFRGVDDATQWNVFHERFELVAIFSGRGCVAQYRGLTADVPARTVFAFEPGNLHKTPRNFGGTHHALILEPALVARLLPERLPLEKLHFAPVTPVVPARVLEQHHRTQRLFDERAEPLEMEHAITRLLATMIELVGEKPLASRLGSPRRDHACALRVLERLDGEFDRTLTLDELAAEARCDKFHLLRCFKALVGIPPHRFVIQKRVSVARRLLARGEPVASVAQAVGFYDQSHLNRHFKRIVGVTPREYASGSGGR